MFDETQQLFSLCCLSYVGMWGRVARDPALLGQLLQRTMSDLRPLDGSWQIVWGPAPSYSRLDILANEQMVFVAQNTKHPELFAVVARGTNVLSLSSVLAVDDILRQKEWPHLAQAISPKPMISAGSARALRRVQSLRAGAGLPGEQQTLLEFLRGVSESQRGTARVVVTGHSFGGALALLLGLWLTDTQSSWDPGGKVEVRAVSFGSPAVGNRAFVDYLDSRLGSRVSCVYNTLDLAVCTCNNESERRQVTSLYAPQVRRLLPWVFTGFLYLVQRAFGVEYHHSREHAVSLEGKLKLGNRWFLHQLLWQHTQGYVDLLGLDSYLNIRSLLRSRM